MFFVISLIFSIVSIFSDFFDLFDVSDCDYCSDGDGVDHFHLAFVLDGFAAGPDCSAEQ